MSVETMLPPSTATAAAPSIRTDWTREQIAALFELPFNDLMFLAQQRHRENFPANKVQLSTLLSIKTGSCPEDCSYCSQSSRYNTGLQTERLLSLEEVMEKAAEARDAGATRYCMGAAWRGPKGRNFDRVIEMIQGVKSLGMEACVTLGMLTPDQAEQLSEAGLDYYNHNIDTSPEFYDKVITTRTFDDRLDTLASVRKAGIHVCSGGIVGMGEAREDRVGMLHTLATLPEHPDSVPINMLVRIPGTPMQDTNALDPIEFVRTIAVARVTMPASFVRLSAGREQMSDTTQALCFMAGANSVFSGSRLLTTDNPEVNQDQALFEKLGIEPLDPRPSACATLKP